MMTKAWWIYSYPKFHQTRFSLRTKILSLAKDEILNVNILNDMDIIHRKAWVENLLKLNWFKYGEDEAKVSLIFQENLSLLNNHFNWVLVICFNYLQ